MSLIHEEKDLEETNRTGVTEERGQPGTWHPQEPTEPSGSKEVPMETVAVTEVTLKTDSSCSVNGIDEGLTG